MVSDLKIVMTRQQFLIKRTFDIAVSFLALIALWPLLGVCALIAQIETGLSGVFTQVRIGRNGKKISVYKIRTMKSDPTDDDLMITVENDPRITKYGRIFRKYKLDELPQLWNVLIGDMSFVGPRPDVPGYADALTGKYSEILKLRPGITGPASIKYRDEEEILAKLEDPVVFNDKVIYPDKVLINIDYLENWSFKKDIEYLLITLGIKPPPQWLTYT